MADEDKKFTHIAIEKVTQRKISILANVLDERIYELVACWAEKDWQRALEAGLVTESMLVGREKVAA